MLDYNNTPLPECEGFTPLQMHKIIYYPFDEDCPIKINRLNKEILISEIPILKIVLELLLILKTKKIKLTQKGNLPLKVIKDIYAKNHLPEKWIESGIVKVRTETDWIVIHNIKIVLTLAGFLRKQYGYLLLTKKCESLLMGEEYSEIFYEFLRVFTLQFNWAYNDRYDDEELGQLGFLYSLYLINKYGKEENDVKYYTDLYFLAFPSFVEYDNENRSMKESAFHTRFISRFAVWFGFAEEEIIKGKKFLELEIKIKRTKLLEQLLEES
jgi:hypothetical protein